MRASKLYEIVNFRRGDRKSSVSISRRVIELAVWMMPLRNRPDPEGGELLADRDTALAMIRRYAALDGQRSPEIADRMLTLAIQNARSEVDLARGELTRGQIATAEARLERLSSCFEAAATRLLCAKGDKGQAICEDCAKWVSTTFDSRTVPFTDGRGEVKEILVAVCDECGAVVATPPQSTPAIRRAREDAAARKRDYEQ